MAEKEDSLLVPKDLKGKVQVTGLSIMQRLREAAAPPGKRPSWLSQLNDKQLAEVFHRLKLGQPAYRIAKICKDEWGYMSKSSPKSLFRAIRAFKEAVLGLLELEKASSSKDRQEAAKKLSKRAGRIVEQLDGLGRLRWLIDNQTDRVVTLIEKEKGALPFQFTDKSIELLGNLIDKYMSIQVKLGIVDVKPSELNLTVKGRFDGLMTHTVEGGQAVITAADKWLEACEQASLTLVLDDKGKYKLERGESDNECPTKGDTA